MTRKISSMLTKLRHWLKILFHTPAHVLMLLEGVQNLDRKIDSMQQRLTSLEVDVQNLPAPIEPDFRPLHLRIDALHQHLDHVAFASGKVKCGQIPHAINSLRDVEFKVFSQFGDDGIIEYLVSTLEIEPKKFIEFGVECYMESNTRFLMQHRNWSGLIIDGSPDNVEWIRKQDFYWRHDLTAVCAFIDADNINKLFADNGFSGPIGLLSIDIDGNDYWVWRAINTVDPVVVVCEFNSTFGEGSAVTIPYMPDFQRTNFHHSNLYWGASLGALINLAEEKGYTFVGCNDAGNNAYFVRNSHVHKVAGQLLQNARFVQAKFREARSAQGELTFAGPDKRLAEIAEMQVFDVLDLKMKPVNSLLP